ncbi:MAG: phosphodiester glycosidase family protein [Cyanobacteria bacterium J06592_8]
MLSLILLKPLHSQVEPKILEPFHLVQTTTGIELYRNSQSDFVQAINLRQGASVELLFGQEVGEGRTAAYGGKNPLFLLQTLQEFWLELTQAQGQRAFSVCNGQFFNLKNPSELAFPVQANRALITTGYAGKSEFPGEKVVLGITENWADILPFSEESNFQQDIFPFDNAIVGIRADGGTKMQEWYSKDPFNPRPRTFIGVADSNQILILTSQRQTQENAAKILQAFGSQKVMMLDGGGSTQLIVEGSVVVPSSDKTPRRLPQAIGVFRGRSTFDPYKKKYQRSPNSWYSERSANKELSPVDR